ncbi:MAG: N-acetylmuramoyl-L-alanine amidase [Candidatus Diapherotrites archaeon]|nr:N-acetylmuramoyl-L-alanine amidase [Candidatus Diapherotrites archaeon]
MKPFLRLALVFSILFLFSVSIFAIDLLPSVLNVQDHRTEGFLCSNPKAGFNRTPANFTDSVTVVLHHTGTDTANSLRLFKQNRTSAHLLIAKDGTIHYICDLEKVADHLKGSGQNTSACANNTQFVSDLQSLDSMEQLSIGIELENSGRKGEEYTVQQYAQLNSLFTYFQQIYQNKFNIANTLVRGHYELEPSAGFYETCNAGTRKADDRKWDPSPEFNWENIGLFTHSLFSSIYSKETCETEVNFETTGFSCADLYPEAPSSEPLPGEPVATPEPAVVEQDPISVFLIKSWNGYRDESKNFKNQTVPVSFNLRQDNLSTQEVFFSSQNGFSEDAKIIVYFSVCENYFGQDCLQAPDEFYVYSTQTQINFSTQGIQVPNFPLVPYPSDTGAGQSVWSYTGRQSMTVSDGLLDYTFSVSKVPLIGFAKYWVANLAKVEMKDPAKLQTIKAEILKNLANQNAQKASATSASAGSGAPAKALDIQLSFTEPIVAGTGFNITTTVKNLTENSVTPQVNLVLKKEGTVRAQLASYEMDTLEAQKQVGVPSSIDLSTLPSVTSGSYELCAQIKNPDQEFCTGPLTVQVAIPPLAIQAVVLAPEIIVPGQKFSMRAQLNSLQSQDIQVKFTINGVDIKKSEATVKAGQEFSEPFWYHGSGLFLLRRSINICAVLVSDPAIKSCSVETATDPATLQSNIVYVDTPDGKVKRLDTVIREIIRSGPFAGGTFTSENVERTWTHASKQVRDLVILHGARLQEEVGTVIRNSGKSLLAGVIKQESNFEKNSANESAGLEPRQQSYGLMHIARLSFNSTHFNGFNIGPVLTERTKQNPEKNMEKGTNFLIAYLSAYPGYKPQQTATVYNKCENTYGLIAGLEEYGITMHEALAVNGYNWGPAGTDCVSYGKGAQKGQKIVQSTAGGDHYYAIRVLAWKVLFENYFKEQERLEQERTVPPQALPVSDMTLSSEWISSGDLSLHWQYDLLLKPQMQTFQILTCDKINASECSLTQIPPEIISDPNALTFGIPASEVKNFYKIQALNSSNQVIAQSSWTIVPVKPLPAFDPRQVLLTLNSSSIPASNQLEEDSEQEFSISIQNNGSVNLENAVIQLNIGSTVVSQELVSVLESTQQHTGPVAKVKLDQGLLTHLYQAPQTPESIEEKGLTQSLTNILICAKVKDYETTIQSCLPAVEIVPKPSPIAELAPEIARLPIQPIDREALANLTIACPASESDLDTVFLDLTRKYPNTDFTALKEKIKANCIKLRDELSRFDFRLNVNRLLNDSMQLTWSKHPQAESYEVYRCAAGITECLDTANFELLSTQTNLVYSDSELSDEDFLPVYYVQAIRYKLHESLGKVREPILASSKVQLAEVPKASMNLRWLDTENLSFDWSTGLPAVLDSSIKSFKLSSCKETNDLLCGSGTQVQLINEPVIRNYSIGLNEAVSVKFYKLFAYNSDQILVAVTEWISVPVVPDFLIPRLSTNTATLYLQFNGSIQSLHSLIETGKTSNQYDYYQAQQAIKYGQAIQKLSESLDNEHVFSNKAKDLIAAMIMVRNPSFDAGKIETHSSPSPEMGNYGLMQLPFYYLNTQAETAKTNPEENLTVGIANLTGNMKLVKNFAESVLPENPCKAILRKQVEGLPGVSFVEVLSIASDQGLGTTPIEHMNCADPNASAHFVLTPYNGNRGAGYLLKVSSDVGGDSLLNYVQNVFGWKQTFSEINFAQPIPLSAEKTDLKVKSFTLIPFPNIAADAFLEARVELENAGSIKFIGEAGVELFADGQSLNISSYLTQPIDISESQTVTLAPGLTGRLKEGQHRICARISGTTEEKCLDVIITADSLKQEISALSLPEEQRALLLGLLDSCPLNLEEQLAAITGNDDVKQKIRERCQTLREQLNDLAFIVKAKRTHSLIVELRWPTVPLANQYSVLVCTESSVENCSDDKLTELTRTTETESVHNSASGNLFYKIQALRVVDSAKIDSDIKETLKVSDFVQAPTQVNSENSSCTVTITNVSELNNLTGKLSQEQELKIQFNSTCDFYNYSIDLWKTAERNWGADRLNLQQFISSPPKAIQANQEQIKTFKYSPTQNVKIGNEIKTLEQALKDYTEPNLWLSVSICPKLGCKPNGSDWTHSSIIELPYEFKQKRQCTSLLQCIQYGNENIIRSLFIERKQASLNITTLNVESIASDPTQFTVSLYWTAWNPEENINYDIWWCHTTPQLTEQDIQALLLRNLKRGQSLRTLNSNVEGACKIENQFLNETDYSFVLPDRTQDYFVKVVASDVRGLVLAETSWRKTGLK